MEEQDSTMLHIAGDSAPAAVAAGESFDDTVAPLIYPEDQGAVSATTQHAVHLLRDHFGGSEAASTSAKANVLFQDLLPEASTTKADATKMFFEVLVLATKDAVKVEQAEGKLGAPIRVRAKRGLWGAWAEREAGGEIAEQEREERELMAHQHHQQQTMGSQRPMQTVSAAA